MPDSELAAWTCILGFFNNTSKMVGTRITSNSCRIALRCSDCKILRCCMGCVATICDIAADRLLYSLPLFLCLSYKSLKSLQFFSLESADPVPAVPDSPEEILKIQSGRSRSSHTESGLCSIDDIPQLQLALRLISACKDSIATCLFACLKALCRKSLWGSKMLIGRVKLAVTLITQAGSAVVTAATCYRYANQIRYTGTDDAVGDVPCDPDAQVSACCGPGSICISNLHCYNANIEIRNVPGTCTDQSFTDPACPCPPSE